MGITMTDIIIPGKYKKRDILNKSCSDFVAMKDGTIVGEKKYCDVSFQCKQLGMKTEFVTAVDPKTGEIIFHDYLCTGQPPFFEERTDDEEAS
jgi:hypothetical protein